MRPNCCLKSSISWIWGGTWRREKEVEREGGGRKQGETEGTGENIPPPRNKFLVTALIGMREMLRCRSIEGWWQYELWTAILRLSAQLMDSNPQTDRQTDTQIVHMMDARRHCRLAVLPLSLSHISLQVTSEPINASCTLWKDNHLPTLCVLAAEAGVSGRKLTSLAGNMYCGKYYIWPGPLTLIDVLRLVLLC